MYDYCFYMGCETGACHLFGASEVFEEGAVRYVQPLAIHGGSVVRLDTIRTLVHFVEIVQRP